MSSIQSVGIREFRQHLYKYTQQNREPLALTSHGETIGYYIPAGASPQKKDLDSLREAVKKLSAMLAEKGLSEDELVADFQELRNSSPQ